MDTPTSNVVALFRAGFPVADVDIIETLLLVATGDEIAIADVERTTMTLEEMAEGFDAKPTMNLKGFAMPLYRWEFPLKASIIRLYVIDAGRYRAFYYQPRTTGEIDLSRQLR